MSVDLYSFRTLGEAAEDLGLSAETLRVQVRNGRFRAALVGKTYITDDAAIAEYRVRSLGKRGRPRKIVPNGY